METCRAPWATPRPSRTVREGPWHLPKRARGSQAGFVLCPLRWLLQVVATSKKPHLKQGLTSSFLRALSRLMRSLRGSLLNGFK